MTTPYDFHQTLLPEGTPDGADERIAETRQCGRCGGVGTHYLTCPALRLPKGYRISDRINDRINDRISDRISDPDRRPR